MAGDFALTCQGCPTCSPAVLTRACGHVLCDSCVAHHDAAACGRVTAGMSWDAPVVAGRPWLLQLVPFYALLLALVPDGDSLCQEQFRRVRARFDAGMDPGSPAEANERWVELVGGVWAIQEKYMQRRAAQMRAKRR